MGSCLLHDGVTAGGLPVPDCGRHGEGLSCSLVPNSGTVNFTSIREMINIESAICCSWTDFSEQKAEPSYSTVFMP